MAHDPDRLPVAERLFGLDPRSLAVFRVALGALLVVDAWDRARDVRGLLTNAGALPEWMTGVSNLWRPSLPFAWHGAELAPVWLALVALAGVALMLGWRTRAAVLVGWVITLSLQSRNALVLYGSDIVLRIMLWWALFLPLAGVASLDRRAVRAPPPRRTALDPSTTAYTLQIAVLYFATYILKRGKTWHDGTAGWYALNMDAYTGPIGQWIRDYPLLTVGGTFATLAIEAVGPWLLFLPWRTAWARYAVIGAFLAFHASLEVALEIGWFPWVSMACWLPLIPGDLWDRLGWQVSEEAPGPFFQPGWSRRLADAVVVLAGTGVLWWNLATWMPNYVWVWTWPRDIMLALRLDQKWDMYAPNPSTTDGWFQVDATLADGSHLDLITGRKPTIRMPDRLPSLYGSLRWNKYMHGLWANYSEKKRIPYLAWHCRTYNALAPEEERAERVALVLVRQKSPRPGEPQKGTDTFVMEELDCADAERPGRIRALIAAKGQKAEEEPSPEGGEEGAAE